MMLLDFMRAHALDDATLAARIGGCTAAAVKKWKYGEREPDASTMLRIQAATAGSVCLADWASQSDQRKAKGFHLPQPGEAA